jgi:flagellar assembly protein FliH
MKDIEAQARAILLRAQQQAEQLLAAAQTEADALKAEQKDLGYAEGKKAGLVDGAEEGKKLGHAQALNEHRAKLTELIASLSEASRQVDSSRIALEASAQTEVVKLAVAIARRVTKNIGTADPTVLSSNINDVMRLVVHSTDVRIALHPSQRDTFLRSLPQLKLGWPALEHVELMEDATISPGGCRISTGQGMIDAGLDEQIDRIAAELLPCSLPPCGGGPGWGVAVDDQLSESRGETANATPPPAPLPQGEGG